MKRRKLNRVHAKHSLFWAGSKGDGGGFRSESPKWDSTSLTVSRAKVDIWSFLEFRGETRRASKSQIFTLTSRAAREGPKNSECQRFLCLWDCPIPKTRIRKNASLAYGGVSSLRHFILKKLILKSSFFPYQRLKNFGRNGKQS